MSDKEVPYEKLLAYAAGELNASETAQVATYLESHPAAAKTVARYRALQAILHAEQNDHPSARATVQAQAIYRAPRPKPRPKYHHSEFHRVTSELGFRYSHFAQRVAHAGLWLRALPVVFLLALSFTSVGGAAAQRALPGEFFYPVKRGVESFWLAVAFDRYHQAQLQIHYARQRLRETQQLVAERRYDSVADTLSAYEQSIADATLTLAPQNEIVSPYALRVRSNAAHALAHFRSTLTAFSDAESQDMTTLLRRALSQSEKSLQTLQREMD